MNKEEKTQRELRFFNQAADAVHAGLERTRSRVRLSLSLRIAAHYCGRLLRTGLAVMLLIALAFAGGCVPGFVSLARRVSAQAPDLPEGMYSQMILQDSRAEARTVPAAETEDRGDWMKECFRTLTAESGIWKPAIRLRSVTAEEYDVVLKVDLRNEGRILLAVLCGVAVGDLLRMLSFLRRRKTLDRKVLYPIRRMTEIARTLSAANLSDRINVAGMKNELQDLAEVINSMLDRIELSYNSQKQFVSDASHELRTPIAVIQGYADMLRRWGKTDPDVLEEGLEAISQETVAMKELVENLLFLARHDKKTLMLEISEFDACDVIREVLRETEMVSKDHVFTLDPEDSAVIRADRGMIKQAIRILTDNAVKYSPEGSTVTLGSKKTENGCILTVTDQGKGIPEEELPKIFERFYRSDAARHSEKGGYGLGLSIARIIVVAHGGKIKVRTRVGEGTSFGILLTEKNA